MEIMGAGYRASHAEGAADCTGNHELLQALRVWNSPEGLVQFNQCLNPSRGQAAPALRDTLGGIGIWFGWIWSFSVRSQKVLLSCNPQHLMP